MPKRKAFHYIVSTGGRSGNYTADHKVDTLGQKDLADSSVFCPSDLCFTFTLYMKEISKSEKDTPFWKKVTKQGLPLTFEGLEDNKAHILYMKIF